MINCNSIKYIHETNSELVLRVDNFEFLVKMYAVNFIIFVSVLISLVNFTSSDSLTTLNWEPGDILKCKYYGFRGFIGLRHWMIGIDDSRNYICARENFQSGTAKIEKFHYQDDIDFFNKDKCYNYGKGKLPADEAVEEAKKWVGETVSFDINTCNNEHWIHYFVNGNPGKWYENQSLMPVNAACDVPSEVRRKNNILAMKWQPGDILKCRLTGFIGNMGAHHYMLGSDDSKHFIHVNGDWQTHEGFCLESRPKDISYIHYDSCENLGTGKLSREEAVANARKWVGKDVTYGILRCNCQHWVYYWADGNSGKFGDNQSLLPIDKNCDIYKDQSK